MSVRAWLRHAAIAGFIRLGIDPRSAQDMLADLGEHKARVSVALAASLIAPLAEVGFITILYAIVDLPQQEAVLGVLERAGLSGAHAWFGHVQPFLITCAVGCLVVTIAAKYTFGYAHAYFLLATFIRQTRRIVQAYLYTSPSRLARIDRATVASLAINESGTYGKVVFSLLDALSNVVASAVFVVTAIALSPALAAIAGVVAIVSIVITSRGFAKQKAVGKRRVQVNSALMGGLWEILNGYRVVKVEGTEQPLLQRLAADLRSKQAWRLEKAHSELFIKLSTEATIYIALLAIIVLSIFAFAVQPATILVFLVLMGRLQKYLGALQQSRIDVQHALPSLTAMSDVIEMCLRDAARPLTRRQAGAQPDGLDVAFDHVSFEYEPDKPILTNLTFSIPPGSRVLIQGPSGQGKSTLLFLACGLLQPSNGEVRMNGVPLTDERFYQLRPSFAYVAPNNYLFRGSIRENLKMGGDCGDAEMAAALDRARLTPLVETLTGGIDADIGENGSNLSLGERQRVMLARIFMKRPLLVLLDEATANLDLENERAVLQDLFSNIDAQATVLMVTHRAPVGVTFTHVYDLVDHRLTLREPVAS
jgi:ABC-type multidrug transport system fused ATPase/permease subunit